MMIANDSTHNTINNPGRTEQRAGNRRDGCSSNNFSSPPATFLASNESAVLVDQVQNPDISPLEPSPRDNDEEAAKNYLANASNSEPRRSFHQRAPAGFAGNSVHRRNNVREQVRGNHGWHQNRLCSNNARENSANAQQRVGPRHFGRSGDRSGFVNAAGYLSVTSSSISCLVN